MQTNPSQDKYKKISQILLTILILNWAVALIKIFYGLATRFSSMTADGFHSLSDGASNIIGLIGIFFASQPKDKNHPYGHKKFETFFSLGISVSLGVVCFNLAKEGIQRFSKGEVPQVDFLSFVVMILTLGVNFWVMNYEFKKGKILKSDILVSDSLHTKADILTSISVIFALALTKMGFPIVDPIITIVISVFIGYSAFGIAKESCNVLCDSAVISDENKISEVVLSVKGVKSCHKIRTRGRSDDIHIDLHIQVNPSMHIEQAHQISNQIEEELKKKIDGVTDVVIHIEPLNQ